MVPIFILTWNEKEWSVEKMQTLIDRFCAGEIIENKWLFSSHKEVLKYDKPMFLLCKTGKKSPGVFAIGRIVSPPFKDKNFKDDEGKLSWYVNIRFEKISDSTDSVLIHRDVIKQDLNVPTEHFSPQASGVPYRGDAEELKRYLDKFFGVDEDFYDEISEKEVPKYSEGACKKVYVNRYERDAKARDECLKHHGYDCSCCGINMSFIYGPELGRNYMHVHHLRMLSEVKSDYVVDPIKDLIPLCPNCHAMVHRSKPPLTIEELKSRITSYRKCLETLVSKGS